MSEGIREADGGGQGACNWVSFDMSSAGWCLTVTSLQAGLQV